MKRGDLVFVPYKPRGFFDAVRFLFHEFFVNRPFVRRVQRDIAAGMSTDEIKKKYGIR